MEETEDAMPLTRSDIEDIFGPVDDHLAVQLAATGATAAEMVEALAWHNSDDPVLNEGRELPTGRVAAVLAILDQADAVLDEEL